MSQAIIPTIVAGTVAVILSIFLGHVEAAPKVQQQLVKDAWTAAHTILKSQFVGCEMLGFEVSPAMDVIAGDVAMPTIKAFMNDGVGSLKMGPMVWLTIHDLKLKMIEDKTLYPDGLVFQGTGPQKHTGKKSAKKCVIEKLKEELERHKSMSELETAMRAYVDKANQCDDTAAD